MPLISPTGRPFRSNSRAAECCRWLPEGKLAVDLRPSAPPVLESAPQPSVQKTSSDSTVADLRCIVSSPQGTYSATSKMKRRLVQWLACPHCHGQLDLTVLLERDDEVEEGGLSCGPCQKLYPVLRGIPRFVSSENYAASFGRQWNKFARLQMDSQNGTSFSRDRFYSITEWDPADLKGKLVLDAGCGAGRFSEVVLQDGAEVVAVDLSSAVDACRQNLSSHPQIHQVQASIYELPFRDGTFDCVYCIGVIQHTPDPQRSVLCLLPKTAIGGKAGLWIYELNWKAFVGTVEADT